MNLKISSDLQLPIEAVTQTFAILAKRGVGKTYAGCVMVEEMLQHGQQVVVADPIGVWWGLRSSADGKSPGFPIVVFGGEHGDVHLEENAGEIVAQSIIENGFSAVLDLSLFRKAAQNRFMLAFAETLYRLNRKPLHFMVDEADEFAPQRPIHGTERLLGAFEDIVRRGRARGLGVTLITQRAAVLNKNVLTQIEVLVVLRTISPQDREAIEAWTEIHGTKKQLEQLSETMASLPVGTAWFWSPGWLDIFKKITVRKKITFDSSATPKVGETIIKPKALAEVNLEQLGAQIKATAETAKANDPAELKREIARLKKGLSTPSEKVVTKEIPTLTDHERSRLTKLIEAFESYTRDFNAMGALVEQVRCHKDEISGEVKFFRDLLAGKLVNQPQKPAHRVPNLPPVQSNGELGKCERALLSVLAQVTGGCDRKKLTLLAGYCWSGSTQNALGKLRSLGYVQGDNGSVMQITETGLKSGHVNASALPQGPALRDYWESFPHFGKCEREILRALFDQPEGLDREGIMQATGYTWSGSTQNALGALRTAGVIVGRNNEVMRVAPEILSEL